MLINFSETFLTHCISSAYRTAVVPRITFDNLQIHVVYINSK